MKIVSCCRALNEERHIKQFCDAYQNIADLILVADGGSEDNTVLLAESMPKTKVRNYPVKVELKNGIWRNPDGSHIQFLVDWAVEEGADWIIFQDCDMRPNKFLKETARDIFQLMEDMKKDFLLMTQIFMWNNIAYFPNMSLSNGQWMQGLWAWRANIGIKIIDKMPHFEFSYDGKTPIYFDKTGKHLAVQPPPCFLHFGWEDLEKTNAHWNYYRKSGLIPGMISPLQIGGMQKPLESWMVE